MKPANPHDPIEVSIILPVFNAAVYLESLIHSLQKQTLETIEIIAVNDGSTDNSLQILQELAKHDPRIRVIDQVNKGVSAARNAGLKQARGNWISFADSDDYVPEHSFQTRLEYAQKNELDLLICNSVHFEHDPQASVTPALSKQLWGQINTGGEWIIHATNNREWPHYVWMQLIRSELITENDINFVTGIWHEDILWTTEVALQATRVGFLEQVCYGYRQNPSSIMHTETDEALAKRAASYLTVIQRLNELAQTSDKTLNKALLFQANRESSYFARLLKKGIQSKAIKQTLAKQYLALNIQNIAFKGVRNVRDFWRFFRFWVIVWLIAKA